eukprot:357744-Chlamydomonas_euryale.AAC.9
MRAVVALLECTWRMMRCGALPEVLRAFQPGLECVRPSYGLECVRPSYGLECVRPSYDTLMSSTHGLRGTLSRAVRFSSTVLEQSEVSVAVVGRGSYTCLRCGLALACRSGAHLCDKAAVSE